MCLLPSLQPFLSLLVASSMTLVKCYLHLILTINAIDLVFTDQGVSEDFFRNDYKYLEKTQSYYKIHTMQNTWNKAKRRCAMEGAHLWFPINQCEADAVLTYLNETQFKFNQVYVGISSRFAKGVFTAIDGSAITYIYNVWAVGEPNDSDGNEDCVVIQSNGYYNDESCTNRFPFICKKTLSSLKWNEECNVPDMDYKYNKQLGRCYKLHLKPLNWRSAYETCDAEQSYLAIVNSEDEARYLIHLTQNASKTNVKYASYLEGQIHLGFMYDPSEDDWRTTSGDTLEEAGYAVWGVNEPDGDESERCGSMYYNGGLNNMACETYKCCFICERDNPIRSGLEERFGTSFETKSQTCMPSRGNY